MAPLNETHDPGLRSWVESAQQPGCDFPIQNLPHGVFRRRGSQERFRGGVAIGDQILDIGEAAMLGVFDEGTRAAAWHAAAGSLNGLMAAGPTAWSALRRVVSRLLREGPPRPTACAAAWSHNIWPSTRCPHASATTPTSSPRPGTP